jgi:hypothetical protein
MKDETEKKSIKKTIKKKFKLTWVNTTNPQPRITS